MLGLLELRYRITGAPPRTCCDKMKGGPGDLSGSPRATEIIHLSLSDAVNKEDLQMGLVSAIMLLFCILWDSFCMHMYTFLLGLTLCFSS